MPSPKVHNYNENEIHFVTLTVIEWIDVFTKPIYFEELLNIIKYHQVNSGLEVFGFVFMTNHIHLLIRAKNGHKLSSILQSLKSYSTFRIKKLLEYESRKYIKRLLVTSDSKKKINDFQLWQNYNYPEIIFSDKFFKQKLNYIHNNPVKKHYVQKPEDWTYSSARNYILNDNTLLKIEKFD